LILFLIILNFSFIPSFIANGFPREYGQKHQQQKKSYYAAPPESFPPTKGGNAKKQLGNFGSMLTSLSTNK
jgi:hypothetical protein